MKKSLKKVLSLFAMLAALMGFSITAAAASPSITFEGFSKGFDFQPGSEYTETDLFNNFKNVMPGDTLTENITFTNSATDCDFVNLYMRAETPEGAEPSATYFLSQLSMKVWNGSELIYDASPDELDGLKENKFLGTFRSGETTTLKVELKVPVELDNEFADVVGEVDWIFHVEAYNESQLTVRKVWSDGNDNHGSDSVTVNLLKDGKVDQTQVLNASNGWAYTFDRLVEGHTWTVEEANIPSDYTVSYDTVGNVTTITNTKNEPAPEPSGHSHDLTVNKVWGSGVGKNHPNSVTVTLYNGSTAYESVRLDASNNWTHTWTGLSSGGNWQVLETNITKGYVPSYSASGDVTTITNSRSLIQTGQLNWPIWVFGGAGIVLVILGGTVLLKSKKQRRA